LITAKTRTYARPSYGRAYVQPTEAGTPADPITDRKRADVGRGLGIVVWIFQDGHLSSLFGFTPAPDTP